MFAFAIWLDSMLTTIRLEIDLEKRDFLVCIKSLHEANEIMVG
jgi:hypothetical protein